MKRLLMMSYLFLFLGMAAWAQVQTVIISGTVTEQGTGLPVVNHEVMIFSDSMNGIAFFTIEYTDNNGFYSDAITYQNPNPSNPIMFTIGTVDCNGMFLSQTATPVNGSIVADFTLCGWNPPACQALFSSIVDPADPFTYQFMDNSFGNVVSWNWDFGDGNFSGSQNPGHTYQNPGFYTVSLSINTSDSCYSTSFDYVYPGDSIIGNCYAHFFILPDTNGFGFSFYDNSIISASSWSWDFGDGTTSTQQGPYHIYNAPGAYTVCLTITTLSGCTATYCDVVFVGNQWNCQANYTYMPDMSALNGFFFQDLSSPDAISWFWDFGDGTFSSQQNPHHIFQGPGMYVVTLSIITADSCSNSFSSVLMVGNPWGCQAAFQSTPTPSNPYTYMFTDFSTGNVIDWTWDFGDGGSSNTQNPVHTYGAPGMYLVTLSITTSDSCWSSFVDFVFPGDSNNFNCFADFNYFPDSSGFGFTFVDFSTGNPIDWTWDFGDGSFATGPVVNHTFSQAGSYMVCLTITTASGCVNTHCYMVTVSGGGLFGNITGWVTANNSFLDEGTVILYVRDPFTGTAFPLDSVMIDSSGYYGFCCLPIGLGDFYVKAVPAPNSVFFNTHLPTYYESAACWADADPVNPDPTAGPYLIELQAVITPAPGNGGIGGIITQGNKLYASGTPLPNIEIMILDMNNTPLMMDYSDVSGQFYFANIPMGTYKVYAEVAFVPTSPAIVTLNTGNPINTGVSIVYTPGGISTGIDNPFNGTAVTELVSVYPNPATDKVNVILNASKAEMMQITLTDIHGRILFTKEITLSTGEQMISLPVDEYTTGLYLLNISNEGSFSQNLKIHIVR